MNSKVLASIMAMGIALMMAGAGALAVFSDTEASRGNTLTAGEMDLKMDAESEYYRDGELYESISLVENDYGNIEAGQDPGTMISFSDVKPGDRGELEISLHVYDNPAHIWMSIPWLEDMEMSINEPEEEAGDSWEDEIGELSKNIEVTVRDWNEDEVFTGTLYELYDLTMDQSTYLGVIDNCTTYWLTMEWEVPVEVGNIIQSDSVEFDIEFYAEQERNNPVEETELQ